MTDRLLNAYLAGSVDEATFKRKGDELRSEQAKVAESLESIGRVAPTAVETALAVFDWCQSAGDRWRISNSSSRRQILDAVCLKRTLSDTTLVLKKRKPFDVFVEGPLCKPSRGDSRCTLLNETAERRLIRLILPEPVRFTGDAITRLVRPGLYANTRAIRKARRQG